MFILAQEATGIPDLDSCHAGSALFYDDSSSAERDKA